MNLRESLDSDPDGLETTFDSALQEMHYAQAFVHGYGQAAELDLTISTNGPTMQLHNLSPEAPTNSAVMRRGARGVRALRTMLMAQLDAIEFWHEDTRQWRSVQMGEIRREGDDE